MSSKTELRLVVLWDKELRMAARAMKKCIDMATTDPENPQLQEIAADAMKACQAALFHLIQEPDEGHIVALADSVLGVTDDKK